MLKISVYSGNFEQECIINVKNYMVITIKKVVRTFKSLNKIR